MSAKKLVVVDDAPGTMTATPASNPFGPLLDPQHYDMMVKISKVFAESNMLPAHFRHRSADVFVTLQLAWRLNLDPMTALQSVYVVSGRPGLSASLVIALANRSGVFKGPINYETKGKGDSMAVTASAVLAATGVTVSATVDMELAKAEKWTKNTKYQTMPEHMLIYRAATWLVRRYCPEVLLGMQTAEELHDITAAATVERISEPAEPGADISALSAAIEQANDLDALAAVANDIKHANGSISAEQTQKLRALYARKKAALSSTFDMETGQIDTARVLSDKGRKRLNAEINRQKLDREAVKGGLIKAGLIKASTNEIADIDLDKIINDLADFAKSGALPEIPDEYLDVWNGIKDEIDAGRKDEAQEVFDGLPQEAKSALQNHFEAVIGGGQ